MKKIKIIAFSVLMIITVQFSVFTCFSAETIKKSAEFTTDSKKTEYKEFDPIIKQNGKEYELSDIRYELLETNKKTEKEDKTTTVIKNNLSSKIYSIDENAPYYRQRVTVDGKEYQGVLTKVEYKEHIKTNRYGEVKGNKSYGLRTSKPTPPKTMILPYYDADTGQNLMIDAPMTSLETTKSEWQYYTYIDITVSNYTDTQFMFNGKIIKHNGSTVLSSDYYAELLNMAGFSDSNHRIKSVYWITEPYKQDAVKCRKARADIQAYACAYTANYYKRFSLNDIPSYTATLTYKYLEENIIKTEYKYKAVASYELIEVETTAEPEPTQATPIEIPKVVKTITTISALLVVSLAFVLLFMFFITKLKPHNNRRKKR